eukprot:TRINITY_DN11279_c0_g1_i1.p3 TRINITY_DN11279_c0_g1~~TRINITY_DN11279_c0_g1_i1.p3  ORF type:complete len:193 (+),score=-11.74 TRINITY_DN11279_c0_g1_i1:248-826(+)
MYRYREYLCCVSVRTIIHRSIDYYFRNYIITILQQAYELFRTLVAIYYEQDVYDGIDVLLIYMFIRNWVNILRYFVEFPSRDKYIFYQTRHGFAKKQKFRRQVSSASTFKRGGMLLYDLHLHIDSFRFFERQFLYWFGCAILQVQFGRQTKPPFFSRRGGLYILQHSTFDTYADCQWGQQYYNNYIQICCLY